MGGRWRLSLQRRARRQPPACCSGGVRRHRVPPHVHKRTQAAQSRRDRKAAGRSAAPLAALLPRGLRGGLAALQGPRGGRGGHEACCALPSRPGPPLQRLLGIGPSPCKVQRRFSLKPWRAVLEEMLQLAVTALPP